MIRWFLSEFWLKIDVGCISGKLWFNWKFRWNELDGHACPSTFYPSAKYTCPYIWSVHFFFQKPHGIVGNASKGTFWQEILSDWQEKSVWPIRTCCRSKHMFTHMRLTHHFLSFFLFVFDKNSVWNYQFAGHDPWSRGTVRHTKHDESVWP